MEIRNDYFNRHQSIINPKRGKRPNDFATPQSFEKEDFLCPFCPGNENQTPIELGRVNQNGTWKIRWVENKYPFLEDHFGKNIIIVETNIHTKQLGDFSNDDFLELLKTYKNIYLQFFNMGYQFPFIFKNFGYQAGASRSHSHSQGAFYKDIPPFISELSKITYQNNNKNCLFCQVIKSEINSQREIIKNKNFISFCPYAPRFNNEVWIAPINHLNNWNDLDDEIMSDFSQAFLPILKVLHRNNWHYNFYFLFGLKNQPLHFHLVITPRLNTWAAVELATQNYVISIAPEQSASFYKDNLTI